MAMVMTMKTTRTRGGTMRGTRETRRERRGVIARAGASTFRDDDGFVSRRKTLAFALAVTSTATLTPRARAYGLNKSPSSSGRESYEERVRKMRDAQRVRDARDNAEADAPSTTLPNGLRYREYVAGEVGEEATKGSRVDARYKVFRLSSGAYFKYSSGGTPVLLWSRGYGAEGRDDAGETISFVLGETPLPRAVTPCVVGMKKGSVRRILVPPNLGWVNDDVVPRPDSFGAARRLINYRDGPLLFEIEVVRVRNGAEARDGDAGGIEMEGDFSYKLPAPPTLTNNAPSD
jgi:FKBP-type peptidyl-prolyl cis-trans isomerase